MVQRLAVRSGFPSFKTAVLGLNQLVLGTHIDFCLGFGKISKKVLLEQPYSKLDPVKSAELSTCNENHFNQSYQ